MGKAPLVSAVRVRVPFRTPIRTAAGLWTHRDSWLVQSETADGRAGWGEAALDFGASDAEQAELESMLAAAIEGRSIEGDAAVARAALSAVGSAPAWSAGRLAGVTVNATIGWRDADAARDAVAAGFGTIKMKVGIERSTAELVDGLAEVRAAAGSAVRLRLDANAAWDVATAGDRLAAAAPFDVEFVEEPVAGVEELAAVRVGSPVRIAADKDVTSPDAARRIVAARAADVMVVKLAQVGGPGPAAEIAALAADEGIPVVLSTLFETGVGLAAAARVAAALPVEPATPATRGPAHGLSTAPLLESSLLTQGLEIRSGVLHVGEPEIDEEALQHYAVARLSQR